MRPLEECIKNKNTKLKPIWLMRQAGRYLPEFREIRVKNPDFIKLCLNANLASNITLQPIKRFKFDAAIIFSDILMLPYGLGQEVNFKKNFGPILGDVDIKKINQTNEIKFSNKLKSVYEALKITAQNELMKNKDLIGFVGAPWTILVYMINKQSPKKNLIKDFLKDEIFINELISIIEKFLKIHINNQIKNGATIIQIFDSWAGLLEEKNIFELIYNPTSRIVDYVKSLNIPVICFPRGIKNYKKYCQIVKPDVINIDYEVDPKKIKEEINITVQGGLNPKTLLTDKENLKKETLKYLDIFKDHPYIFNLGHGVLPETNPNMVDYLVKLVKDY
mgnify:CR=1 FL=1|tara:strand:+ start:693 stop:1694 length:1002 start_codon:yes stop_codon:yes gene_type:complete